MSSAQTRAAPSDVVAARIEPSPLNAMSCTPSP
jgi:hypothetical protein